MHSCLLATVSAFCRPLHPCLCVSLPPFSGEDAGLSHPCWLEGKRDPSGARPRTVKSRSAHRECSHAGLTAASSLRVWGCRGEGIGAKKDLECSRKPASLGTP